MYFMDSGIQTSNILFSKQRSKAFLDLAKKETREDLIENLQNLVNNQDLTSIFKTIKSVTSTSSWLSHSYYRYYKSLLESNETRQKSFLTLKEEEVIQKVIRKNKVVFSENENKDIFKAIYKEALLSHTNPHVSSRLILPRVETVIVVLDGVFNELFSQSFFERSLKKLSYEMGVTFLIPKISGFQGTEENSKIIKNEIEGFSKKFPKKKFWLLGYSKGGIDALHYISQNKSFAEEKVLGLSTLASPLLGVDKFNRGVLKVLVQIKNNFSNEKIRKDIFFEDIQKSLDSNFQRIWFLKNYKSLPKNIFYSSLGFETDWKEAHLWMLLTKAIFQSPKKNDGVVDCDDAHFPWFFPSLNLGIIDGHHLFGMRSTFHSQEAILESLLIFLNFKGLLN